ncbi:MAG: NAD(P)H-dependent glycerol-3-phosphate dehydrogenase [Pseudomonadota bacterium]
MHKINKIGVVGAGSWGTALANLLALKGFDVSIWCYEAEVSDGINKAHRNPLYLNNISLSKRISATTDISQAVADADFIISALPSRVVKTIWEGAKGSISKDAIIVNTTKGIEIESCKLMHDVFQNVLTNFPAERIVVLSGPSFAREVSLNLPTLVTVAGMNKEITKEVQKLFRTETFLTFISDDVAGVEVGGAVKNVIAIACGIADGLRLGQNARAAIITRGLYEMIKIGKSYGANPLTFTGLAGIGDLTLTCTSKGSRNHELGFAIGEGTVPGDYIHNMKMVAEGYSSAKPIHAIAKERNISAPICATVYQILYEGMDPKKAVTELTSSELGEELRSII